MSAGTCIECGFPARVRTLLGRCLVCADGPFIEIPVVDRWEEFGPVECEVCGTDLLAGEANWCRRCQAQLRLELEACRGVR